jgi:hypothetical protein
MSPIDLTYFGLTVAVVAFALIAGRRPERLSAIIFAAATVATQVIASLAPRAQANNLLLLIDGVMAISFLMLALRYGYLWIALMMAAMAGYFSIHAYYLAMTMPLDRTFAMANNLATAVALLSIAIGVWTSRRRAAEEA